MGQVVQLKSRKPGPEANVPLDRRTDDQLMLLARGGKPEAFDALVLRHQVMVYRIALKYLGDPMRAQDVAQDCFVELHRALATYSPQGKLVSFLGKITINHCRMALRAERSEHRALNRMLKLDPHAPALAEELLLEDERRREVERHLNAISPKLREVVILRFGAEMTYKQIAETLQIRLGTVKSRLFAGLEKLSGRMSRGGL